MQTITKEQLTNFFKQQGTSPFPYDIGINVVPAKKDPAAVMICCHGYGDDSTIVERLGSYNVIIDHLIGFNFPDYVIAKENSYDPSKSSFGTIDELLPLLYVIKLCVIDLRLKRINLYGKSAGAGALINTLAVLNTDRYVEQLANIGIGAEQKKQIVTAIEQGIIILDRPLKSIEEIIALRGPTAEFEILAKQFARNDMRPVDTVQQLKNLKLNILLHFQDPDEITGNQDDERFINRLRQANKGTTKVIIGNEGGHNAYPTSLWYYYITLGKDLVS